MTSKSNCRFWLTTPTCDWGTRYSSNKLVSRLERTARSGSLTGIYSPTNWISWRGLFDSNAVRRWNSSPLLAALSTMCSQLEILYSLNTLFQMGYRSMGKMLAFIRAFLLSTWNLDPHTGYTSWTCRYFTLNVLDASKPLSIRKRMT